MTMTAHKTTVTAVRRATHEIARIVCVARCTVCKWRFECLDDERTRREALRHETASVDAGDGGAL